MSNDTLKAKLGKGELTIGSWVTLAHPGLAEIMARAGFDWLTVDIEHSSITIGEAENLLRVIDLCGVTSLVRLTSNDPNLIKRVMDSGAHGIIVPLINTADDARRAVSAVYYPSKGNRGVGLARAQGYGAAFKDYCSWLDANAVVIVMIEHIDAVNNLESILSVQGVDGYIIGPYDLSASMGIPGQLDHPNVVRAIERIKSVSAEMRRPGGLHVVEPEPDRLLRYVDQGFRFMAYSLDIRILDTACRKGIEQIRRSINSKPGLVRT